MKKSESFKIDTHEGAETGYRPGDINITFIYDNRGKVTIYAIEHVFNDEPFASSYIQRAYYKDVPFEKIVGGKKDFVSGISKKIVDSKNDDSGKNATLWKYDEEFKGRVAHDVERLMDELIAIDVV